MKYYNKSEVIDIIKEELGDKIDELIDDELRIYKETDLNIDEDDISEIIDTVIEDIEDQLYDIADNFTPIYTTDIVSEYLDNVGLFGYADEALEVHLADAPEDIDISIVDMLREGLFTAVLEDIRDIVKEYIKKEIENKINKKEVK